MKISHNYIHTLPNGGKLTIDIMMHTDMEGHSWTASSKLMDITPILHNAAVEIAKLSEHHESKE